jgi:autotransporter adhesin
LLRCHQLLGAAALALTGAMAAGTAAEAQVINVCTGLRATLPALTPITDATSGLLSGALDPILNGIVGDVNDNIYTPLNGQQIGVQAFDTDGNPVSLPGNCSVAVDGVTVNADQGITMGGGRIDGLGGPTNDPASAGEVNSIAIGNGATTSAAATDAVGIGRSASVTAASGTAVGANSSVTAAGGVAIGAGSMALRGGMAGATEAFSGTSVGSTNGAVSVGTAGGERQITNVAGGTADTDAVNVRQLKSVANNLATTIGGGASFDSTTGAFTGPTFTIRGSNYTTVASAIAALDSAVSPSAIPIAANNTSALAAPTASGSDALAVGYGAVASGASAAAFGTGAVAAGNGSVATGPSAVAAGTGSIAIGRGATAAQAGAVAIGADATTTRANQVAIGGSGNTYTLAGVNSAASTAAQSGPVRVVTADASGNLATTAFDITDITTRIDKVERDVSAVSAEAREGIAMAMAMTSASMPSAGGKTSWASNVATFSGQVAGSFGVAHRFDTSFPFAVTGSVGIGTSRIGARVGLAGEF